MPTKRTATKPPQDWVITVPAKRVKDTRAAIKRAVQRLKAINAEIEETGGKLSEQDFIDMYLLAAIITL